jgi:hypothetical protein
MSSSKKLSDYGILMVNYKALPVVWVTPLLKIFLALNVNRPPHTQHPKYQSEDN